MSANVDKTKFTQSMTIHMNGGSKYSRLVYDVLYDGRSIGCRITETNGRPKYLKTSDVIEIGSKRFDVLETKGIGLEQFLIENAPDLSEPTA